MATKAIVSKKKASQVLGERLETKKNEKLKDVKENSKLLDTAGYHSHRIA
jgi:hypothetical protein